MSEAEKREDAQEKKGEAVKVKMAPNPFPAEEVYVDGVSGILGRGGIFKVDCYRVVGLDHEDKAEVRQITHRIVFPVQAMPELLQAIQGVMKAAEQEKSKS